MKILKKRLAFLTFVLASLQVSIAFAQEVKVLKFEELQNVLEAVGDRITIVNFWATWCEPCVEEIPHFIEVYQEKQKTDAVDIIFVSLDRLRDTKQVETFVTEQQMPGKLLLLDDLRRMNQWIPKIDADWQGAIPATGFYQNGRLLKFHVGMIEKEELIGILDELKS